MYHIYFMGADRKALILFQEIRARGLAKLRLRTRES